MDSHAIKPYATRRYNDWPRYCFLPSFWANCSKMMSGRPGLGAVAVGCAGTGSDAGATAAFMAFPFDRLGCWKNIATHTANVPAGLAPAERRIDHYKAFFPADIAFPLPPPGRRPGGGRGKAMGVAVLVANPSLRRRRVGGGVYSVSCNNGHQYTPVNNQCQVLSAGWRADLSQVLAGKEFAPPGIPRLRLPPRMDNRRSWGNPGLVSDDQPFSSGLVAAPRRGFEPMDAMVEPAALRKCIARGTPYGKETWQHVTAERLGLEASLQPRGRPPIIKTK